MKKLLLLTILLMSAIWLFAGVVPLQKAQTVAQNFIKATIAKNATVQLYKTDSAFYIFNILPKGFIIISAEDNAEPIRAYSFDNNFSDDISILKNTGVNDILEWNRKNVRHIRQNHIPGSQHLKDKWNALIAGLPPPPESTPATSVPALCQTLWNQSSYYQLYCPAGTYNGCVAVCMGQIMKFWNYPPKGTGSHCYTDAPYGTLCANFNHPYNWAAMQNNATSPDTNASRLLSDVGIAMEMQYNTYGSGAPVYDYGCMWACEQDALASKCSQFTWGFGYDKGIRCISNDSACRVTHCNPYIHFIVKASDYIDTLKHQIDLGQPISMAGGDIAAHCWVCDGYDVTNHFHMNWGWGGYDNGYYALDGLTNIGGYNFNGSQYCLIGIKPGVPVACKPQHQVQTVSCPPNYSGTEIQTRNLICPQNTYTTWADSINSCTLNPPPTLPIINKVSRDTVYFTPITGTAYTKFRYKKPTATSWTNTGNKAVLSPYYLAKVPCCAVSLQLEINCYNSAGGIIGTSLPFNFVSEK